MNITDPANITDSDVLRNSTEGSWVDNSTSLTNLTGNNSTPLFDFDTGPVVSSAPTGFPSLPGLSIPDLSFPSGVKVPKIPGHFHPTPGPYPPFPPKGSLIPDSDSDYVNRTVIHYPAVAHYSPLTRTMYDVTSLVMVMSGLALAIIGFKLVKGLLPLGIFLWFALYASMFARLHKFAFHSYVIWEFFCTVPITLLCARKHRLGQTLYSVVCGYGFGIIVYGFILHIFHFRFDYMEYIVMACGAAFGFAFRYFFGHDLTDQLDSAFSGGYFVVAASDWFGYRWNYTHKTVFWINSFFNANHDLVDCTSAWCICTAVLWLLLIPVSVQVQRVMRIPSLARAKSELDELAPLMDQLADEGVPEDERLNLARMRYALENTKLKRQQIKEQLKLTRKNIRDIKNAKFNKLALGSAKKTDDDPAPAADKPKRKGWLGSLFSSKKSKPKSKEPTATKV